jgi:hypothetical protein
MHFTKNINKVKSTNINTVEKYILYNLLINKKSWEILPPVPYTLSFWSSKLSPKILTLVSSVVYL